MKKKKARTKIHTLSHTKTSSIYEYTSVVIDNMLMTIHTTINYYSVLTFLSSQDYSCALGKRRVEPLPDAQLGPTSPNALPSRSDVDA